MFLPPAAGGNAVDRKVEGGVEGGASGLSRLEVLVVGAGPVGLMTAVQVSVES